MQSLKEFLKNNISIISEDKMIQGALIFFVAVVIALIAKFIIGRLQKIAATRTSNSIDDHLYETLKQPLYISILLIGFYLGLEQSALIEKKLDPIKSILLTIAIFFWMRAAIVFIRFLLKHFSRDQSRVKIVQKHTLPLFENFAVILLFALAVYLIIVAWGWNVTGWLASAGIMGLALSFAAKDTLANLFAGVFILADSPYKIGDFIVLETGERGMVTHIGIRSTRILTRSDVEITIPNAIMGNTKVINETSGPHSKFRIEIKVGVAYGSDIALVRNTLMEASESVAEVEKTPPARVRFRTFGDSSLNFELLCWVAEPVLRGKVEDLLNEAVYNLFNQNNIQIPFPQTDVHLYQKG